MWGLCALRNMGVMLGIHLYWKGLIGDPDEDWVQPYRQFLLRAGTTILFIPFSARITLSKEQTS